MMNSITPWASAASHVFAEDKLSDIFSKTIGNYTFRVHCTHDSLWLEASWPKGGNLVLRMAFAPAGDLSVTRQTGDDKGVKFHLTSVTGNMTVALTFTGDAVPIVNYKTTLTPSADLLIPFWPRDMVIPGKGGKPENTTGKIHVHQVGTRSGLIYMSMTRPKAGSVFYFQNLTSLNDYCRQTETSAAETVGGEWPELGFALPSTTVKGKPLAAGKAVVISDAFVAFDELVPKDEPAMVHQFLDLLAAIYLQLPKPETTYQHWPTILDKGIKDLVENPGCWSQVDGHSYFNAYMCDYATPPEIMVQLAILLPLVDYTNWSKTDLEVIKKIKAGLPNFYNDKLGTIMRWHPKVADQMEGEEEQKHPMVMDSWYLHHPLLNLSRMALKGDKMSEKLFLDSINFAIKVAHHFKYRWPVFYNMETLAVIKEETAPGKGGEKDVAGLYAHIMLQAYELTGKKYYLREAEKAAKTLQGLGFDLFYQANNTAFSSGALLRLYKITKNKLYLELSYMCIAAIFKNVHIWDCNYGFGKNFPSFFALFPLNDAPYTAAYEEQEVFCAFHDYLHHAEGEDILPSVSLLLAEFIRYIVQRAVYYYPTMLPKEMLSPEVKMGEVDPNMWIALEDMHDGWEPSGQVGQEVYGAGNAFGILPRHYFKIAGQNFMLYADYPVLKFTLKKNKAIWFTIKGDERLICRVMMVKTDARKLPAFTATNKKGDQEYKGTVTNDKHLEYSIPGNQTILISWE